MIASRKSKRRSGARLPGLAVAAATIAASCQAVLDIDDVQFADVPGGGGSATGGMGGGEADCPDGQQDNDRNGTCEPACTIDSCSGHGTCDDSSGTATCTCDFRYAGDDCASCAAGYTGPDCAGCDAGYQDADDDGTCLPECDSATCSGNGTCDDASGTATCTCRPGFSGADCSAACPAGTAGSGCAYRIIFGLDLPAAVENWDDVSDVPYDVDAAANASAFDRVAYRLILDDEEVWVAMDAFVSDAAELGVPMDVIHDVPVTDVTVLSFAANQPSIVTPTDGNVELWSNCYSPGLNGEYDYDDDITTADPDCYGSVQVHVNMQTVLAFNRWSSTSGSHDLGIGPSPTGNPDYTFEQNAADYSSRRLEVYIREL